MRKIETKEEKKLRERRKNIILTIVIIFIMVFSTFAYAIFSREDNPNERIKIRINGRDFFYNGYGYWLTQKEGKSFIFNNLPNETKNIYVDNLKDLNYKGKKVYFVNSKPSFSLIIDNIEDITFFQEACLDEKCSEEKNLPIKDCSDYLIIFKDSEETRVLKDKNCLVLEGDSEKATDAFLYKFLGIT